jgi:hypothetical protein
MPGRGSVARCIHAHGRAPTCFIRSNDCVCISPVCDERDNVAISQLTRRYRVYESLEVRAKARGHDQNTTWRLFRPSHSGGCGDRREIGQVCISRCFRFPCLKFFLCCGGSNRRQQCPGCDCKERGGRERVFTVFLLKYHRLSSGQLIVGSLRVFGPVLGPAGRQSAPT